MTPGHTVSFEGVDGSASDSLRLVEAADHAEINRARIRPSIDELLG